MLPCEGAKAQSQKVPARRVAAVEGLVSPTGARSSSSGLGAGRKSRRTSAN